MLKTGSSNNGDVKRKYSKQYASGAGNNNPLIFTHRKRDQFSGESDISCTQIQLRNKLNRNRNDVHSGYVKRKYRFNWALSTSLLLVLNHVIVNFELVLGALPLSYNSINDVDNSSYALSDDLDIRSFFDASVHNHLDERSPTRHPVIYQNEFAVFIPGGEDRANKIAEKYGFSNIGQVRTFFKEFFLNVPTYLFTEKRTVEVYCLTILV